MTPAFQPPGKRARATPVWAAFFLLWAFWLIGNLATVPVLLPVLLPKMLAGHMPTSENTGLILLLTLYVMFAVFAGCAILWVRLWERRSLASMGLSRRGAPGLYTRGLLRGVLFAGVLLAVATLAGDMVPEQVKPAHPFSLAALGHPGTILVMAVLGMGLLVQSAAEEIICRGWVLSSVAMRHGRRAGLVASALFFGSLHVHFLFLGNWRAGLVALVSVTLMGLMLGLFALKDGAIAGAAGLHGAFNTLVLGATLVAVLGTGAAPDALGGVSTAFDLGTKPQSLNAESFAQGALALTVCVYLWWRWRAGSAGQSRVISGPE